MIATQPHWDMLENMALGWMCVVLEYLRPSRGVSAEPPHVVNFVLLVGWTINVQK